jgi:hypothetical protein
MRTMIRALLTMIIASATMIVAVPAAHAAQSPSVTRAACEADRNLRDVRQAVSKDRRFAYRLVKITAKRSAITKWSNAGCRAIAHGTPRTMMGMWRTKIVYGAVPLCTYEDGSGPFIPRRNVASLPVHHLDVTKTCLWDAWSQGNGKGSSLLITRTTDGQGQYDFLTDW